MLSSNPRRESPRPVAHGPATPATAVANRAPDSSAAPPATIAVADSQNNDPFRKIAFYSSLALLFVRFSALPEVIYFLTGLNTYILYLVAPPAIAGALFAGGIRRTFRHRAAYFWTAFSVWLILATPVSYWPGGSAGLLFDYFRDTFPLLIVVGGLATNWKDIRAIFYVIAAGGIMNLLTAQLFSSEKGGRVQLEVVGTIGNSNDLASQLLLVLPFLLFVAMDSRRNIVVRLALYGSVAYGLWIILGTASRGALVALAVAGIFLLWHASMKQRILGITVAALLALAMLATVPKSAFDRLATLFGEQHQEAKESAESRSYLLRKSIAFSIQHPIFGVGPGEFSNYEGQSRVKEGLRGNWHATHNAYTQVSSECGTPALIFLLCGLASSVLTVNRTFRTARRQGNREITNACFCYLLAMVGFLTSLIFLANAYRFYLPVMVGLAISLSFAAAGPLTAEPRPSESAG
jgi:O-antigen ligase